MKFACAAAHVCRTHQPSSGWRQVQPATSGSSIRNGSNCEFSSTLHSNCMTSSSILLNFSFHCLLNLALSYLSPSNSTHAKNQNTLNQNSCKQIKSIKLPSNLISPNKIKPNQISSNQIKSNYGKQFNSMNQRN